MSIFRRDPPEVRRLRYRLTLLEELFAVLKNPTQLGLILGALVGAATMALLRAGNDYSARKPAPSDGLVLPTSDPTIQAAAAKLVEQALRERS
jgi:hypothetical protein